MGIDNDWYNCLRKAKHLLEIKGEHMGTGEMFRLIILARAELPKMRLDDYLVKNNRDVHDAIYYGAMDYIKEYYSSPE